MGWAAPEAVGPIIARAVEAAEALPMVPVGPEDLPWALLLLVVPVLLLLLILVVGAVGVGQVL